MSRTYKTSFDELVDLGDPKTYEYLPNTIKELEDRMLKNIGHSLSYMDFIHREGFPMDNKQRWRVYELINRFWKYRHNNLDNVMWYQENVFLFEDEIENMC